MKCFAATPQVCLSNLSPLVHVERFLCHMSWPSHLHLVLFVLILNSSTKVVVGEIFTLLLLLP